MTCFTPPHRSSNSDCLIHPPNTYLKQKRTTCRQSIASFDMNYREMYAFFCVCVCVWMSVIDIDPISKFAYLFFFLLLFFWLSSVSRDTTVELQLQSLFYFIFFVSTFLFWRWEIDHIHRISMFQFRNCQLLRHVKLNLRNDALCKRCGAPFLIYFYFS